MFCAKCGKKIKRTETACGKCGDKIKFSGGNFFGAEKYIETDAAKLSAENNSTPKRWILPAIVVAVCLIIGIVLSVVIWCGNDVKDKAENERADFSTEVSEKESAVDEHSAPGIDNQGVVEEKEESERENTADVKSDDGDEKTVTEWKQEADEFKVDADLSNEVTKPEKTESEDENTDLQKPEINEKR